MDWLTIADIHVLRFYFKDGKRLNFGEKGKFQK